MLALRPLPARRHPPRPACVGTTPHALPAAALHPAARRYCAAPPSRSGGVRRWASSAAAAPASRPRCAWPRACCSPTGCAARGRADGPRAFAGRAAAHGGRCASRDPAALPACRPDWGHPAAAAAAAGLQGLVMIKGEPRRGLISDDDTSDKLKVGLVFQVGGRWRARVGGWLAGRPGERRCRRQPRSRLPPMHRPGPGAAAAAQSGALFDSLTVGENVGFLLHEHTQLPPAKIEVRGAALTWRGGGWAGLGGSGLRRAAPCSARACRLPTLPSLHLNPTPPAHAHPHTHTPRTQALVAESLGKVGLSGVGAPLPLRAVGRHEEARGAGARHCTRRKARQRGAGGRGRGGWADVAPGWVRRCAGCCGGGGRGGCGVAALCSPPSARPLPPWPRPPPLVLPLHPRPRPRPRPTLR